MSAVIAANILKREQAVEDAKPKFCDTCKVPIPSDSRRDQFCNQYWCSDCWRAAMKCDPR